MSKYSHKIKAFTLTEMMVVIVISAIVVGLAFTILGIVQHNMRSIENNYEYHSQVQSLETALTIDFSKYPNARWNPKDNQLILSSPIEERIYTFYTDSIQNEVETYLLKTKSTTYYFEGNEVGSGAIDALKFSFEKTTDLHRIFIYKYNDPTIHF